MTLRAGSQIRRPEGASLYTIAKVAVEDAAYCYDKAYDYLVPGPLESAVRAGCRVRVPFGRGNRARTGLVLEVVSAPERDPRCKPLAALLDRAPVLDGEGLMLLRYLKECTFCTWFDALRVLIPAGISIRPQYRYEAAVKAVPEDLDPGSAALLAYLVGRKRPVEEKTLLQKGSEAALVPLLERGLVEKSELLRHRVRDEKVVMVRLLEDAPDLPMTKRQKEVAAFLSENGACSLKEICYYLACTRAVADRMRDSGLLEYYDVPRFRTPYGAEAAPAPPPALSPAQEEALEALDRARRAPKPRPCLLYGVTGAGKTEVFLALIGRVLDDGKGVIVLVPEISLTAQTVRGFRDRFGGRVAVLHSGLSLGERMDEWRRIQQGKADIVVGTRSAVFAPLANIGLIVLDEEQEHTYHSEQSPRFHAREVAKVRCGHHGALLLLASATPSVETYHRAKEGKYLLVELTERFGAAELPDVYIVDMKDNAGPSALFSEALLTELHYNLEQGEQSILLLNRRGYATLVRCSSCGAVEECPHCSVSMTFHSANDSLVCHYCGYTKKKPARCAACGSDMVRFSGSGTQKAAEELAGLYPDARILRVDMDTTLSKFSHQRLFQAFSDKEYDIMIGTQMVAKGLNFPDVTLVGVLAADQSLYAMDFRSYERSFSLLTQVVGRSGRGASRGRALVQTYSPDHPIIALAAEQDYPAFFAQEIRSRRHHLYPPFCTMAGIGFVGLVQQEVRDWAERFLERFRETARGYPDLPVRVLGPVGADTFKAAGKYRQKLIVKCRGGRATRALLRELLLWFTAECKTVRAFIDMYYDRI